MKKPGKGKSSSRATAAAAIARWLDTGEFPDRLIEPVEADRAFVMEMVHGIAKWRRQLEWILDRLADRRPDAEISACVFVGLYQVFHMSAVVDYAAVNETVEAVKRTGSRRAAGFVNAILRRGLREKEAILAALKEQPLAVRESHPDILVERWTRQYGEGDTARFCAWNNLPADVIIRVNANRTTSQEYRALLAEQGIEVEPHPFRPDTHLVLPRGCRVTDLPGYDEGLFFVQDPSSSLAVEMLDPRPGEAVLDGCVSPGGKILLMAERMKGKGTLVALGLPEDRLGRLRENLVRMGAGFVRVAAADVTAAPEKLAAEGLAPEGGFDAVLLDVPCSNTGVLRRRPDARWRFRKSRLARLTAIQRGMLDSTARLVRRGGRLVYSTCSLEPEECEEMVAGWVREHAGFKIAKSVKPFPPATRTDGGFAALLNRGK